MKLDAALFQPSLAGNLIEAVLGQAHQAQTELVLKMARISLATNITTAALKGTGSMVDLVA